MNRTINNQRKEPDTHEQKVHYLGMDVHKESIEIAIAVEGGEVRRYGKNPGGLTKGSFNPA